MFGARPAGTHAHSWIMSFDSELEAFRAYAEVFPDSCLLLVDTYDTLGKRHAKCHNRIPGTAGKGL